MRERDVPFSELTISRIAASSSYVNGLEEESVVIMSGGSIRTQRGYFTHEMYQS